MQCPKCKSENVLVQQVQVGADSKTKTKGYSNGMGCAWWMFIGWWWVPFKKIFGFCADVMFIFPIFLRKRERTGELTGKTKTKVKNRTMATCQNCGYTWKV